MKRKLAFIVSFVLLLLAYGVFTITADTNYKFFVNGAEIVYSKNETLPRIVNDRFMVPVAQTVEQLGISLNWDKETGTMTMLKNGISSYHVLYSNVVTINGVARHYDAPSMVIDGTTMIPTVMLADIIGYDSYWNPFEHIIALRPGTAGRGGAYPEEAYVGLPEVISATSNKTQVASGEEFIVSVLANSQTTSVNLVDIAGRVLATSSNFTKAGDGNSFTLRYTPYAEIVSFLQYKVQAGDATGYYSGSSKIINITVNQGFNLINASVNSSAVYLGDTARITVTTSGSVSRVRLTDTGTGQTYERSSYVSSGGNRVFTFDVNMSEAGNKTFSIEIGSSSTYIKTQRTLSVTVNGASNSPIAVNSVSYSNTTYSIGDRVSATVRTSLSAVKVEVYDSQARNTSTYTSSSVNGSYREFDISVSPSSSGSNSFTATAYDSNGRRASRSFTVSARNYYTTYNYNYNDSNYGYYDVYGNWHYWTNEEYNYRNNGYYYYNGKWYYGNGYYNDYYYRNGYYYYNGQWYYGNGYYNGYYDAYGNWHYYGSNYSYSYIDSSGVTHHFTSYNASTGYGYCETCGRYHYSNFNTNTVNNVTQDGEILQVRHDVNAGGDYKITVFTTKGVKTVSITATAVTGAGTTQVGQSLTSSSPVATSTNVLTFEFPSVPDDVTQISVKAEDSYGYVVDTTYYP